MSDIVRCSTCGTEMERDRDSKGRAHCGSYYCPVCDVCNECGAPPFERCGHETTFDGGQRVQLHPSTDAWMQGDRYGEVVDTQQDGTVTIKMDKSGRNLRCPPELLQKV